MVAIKLSVLGIKIDLLLWAWVVDVDDLVWRSEDKMEQSGRDEES